MIQRIVIAGAGAMGTGIAQIAAQAGYSVTLYEPFQDSIIRSKKIVNDSLTKLTEKHKLTVQQAAHVLDRMHWSDSDSVFNHADLILEAVPELVEMKKNLFSKVSMHASPDAIIATNTSSLSIASLSASVANASRFIGIHFFNPATIMPLVEVIPGILTNPAITAVCNDWCKSLGKTVVIAKDTPGFIVNRLARPFYGEALRIQEEGLAGFEEIDEAMKSLGFRMGPFELMDFIGHDVNFLVTQTVWEQFFYDPRYRPSILQKRLYESGLFGKKTGRGYYEYDSTGSRIPQPVNITDSLKRYIGMRILSMLINEAIEALHLSVGNARDLDEAMMKGVGYPKGLLKWADEIGPSLVLETLDTLYEETHDMRYRASVLLRRAVKEDRVFSV